MLIILVPLLSICVSFDKRFFFGGGGGLVGVGVMSIYFGMCYLKNIHSRTQKDKLEYKHKHTKNLLLFYIKDNVQTISGYTFITQQALLKSTKENCNSCSHTKLLKLPIM